MHKQFLITASFLGALSVLLGAFAAHKLKDILEAQMLQTFETAVKYQMYHALALLAVGILFKDFSSRQMVWAGWSFIAGTILFSGSLYLLCFLKHQDMSFKWVGPITPFGGLCFIAGWILLAVGISKTTVG
ncbi:MAG TPA: DUF423 domain-containing protein [Ferruginibacter sp.]|nr:DUF423 domain-containing protein [Ferruginibacter sp.]HPH92778.1 DUF423 domain-containing protein [Ferruginibacter sp.]